MKRPILTVVMLFAFVLMSQCQSLYRLPQTVAWDDPAEAIASEVSVVRVIADREDPASHTILGAVSVAELFIETLPVGVYVVAVRSRFTVDGYEAWSDYAYSDIDHDPVFGKFYLIVRPGEKPEMMKLR